MKHRISVPMLDSQEHPNQALDSSLYVLYLPIEHIMNNCR